MAGPERDRFTANPGGLSEGPRMAIPNRGSKVAQTQTV